MLDFALEQPLTLKIGVDIDIMPLKGKGKFFVSLVNKPEANEQTNYTYNATTPDTTCNNGAAYTLNTKDTTSLKVGSAAGVDLNTYSPVGCGSWLSIVRSYVHFSDILTCTDQTADSEMPRQTQLRSKQHLLTTKLAMEQPHLKAEKQAQAPSRSAAPDFTMPAKPQATQPPPQAS